LSWAISISTYNKFYYWITNKRIITKRGIIGYQIVSIPHERISDIIISRTFFENIFGIASLHVQSLAGQTSFRGYSATGSEGQLFAIPKPEETQNKILKLIRAKRKAEGLTI
ncbi:MAG: PH domain-containing protein, partial [Candidatus Aenigmarchaeota archaeon]|nr:PH domain-containing protein [Candidatus Aenigmarchaeota archaeon]MDI6722155.1 PH domain-containing protein [Candidatus Aenigmarchaeota archaeon]